MTTTPIRKPGHRGQTMIEFAAAMVMTCLLVYAMIQIFRWGMMDLAERRYDHEWLLSNATGAVDGFNHGKVLDQINPYFHGPRPMDASPYRPGGTP